MHEGGRQSKQPIRLPRELLREKALWHRTENEVFLKSEWPVIKMTTTWALEKRGFRNPKNLNGLSVLDKECLEDWLWSKASHSWAIQENGPRWDLWKQEDPGSTCRVRTWLLDKGQPRVHHIHTNDWHNELAASYLGIRSYGSVFILEDYTEHVTIQPGSA